MIELDRRQSRLVRQGILDEVASFCHARSLRFFLSGSTLLGAVREKGVLAWNDRISIMLPRPDYVELERVFNVYAKQKGLALRLVTAENVEAYGYSYAKIVDTTTVLVTENESADGLGISVCVVAVDGLGNERRAAEKICMKTERLAQILRYKTYGNEAVAALDKGVRLEAALSTRRSVVAKLKEPSPYGYEQSELVGVLGVGYKKRAIVKKAVFDSAVEVELDGKAYPAPVGYDEYLQALFDDYMSLPPQKERNEVRFKVYSQSKSEE